MTHVLYRDGVLTRPEEWHGIESLATAQDIACGDLSLAQRYPPVLDANESARMGIRPAGDVAGGKNSGDAGFEIFVDHDTAIHLQPSLLRECERLAVVSTTRTQREKAAAAAHQGHLLARDPSVQDSAVGEAVNRDAVSEICALSAFDLHVRCQCGAFAIARQCIYHTRHPGGRSERMPATALDEVSRKLQERYSAVLSAERRFAPSEVPFSALSALGALVASAWAASPGATRATTSMPLRWQMPTANRRSACVRRRARAPARHPVSFESG